MSVHFVRCAAAQRRRAAPPRCAASRSDTPFFPRNPRFLKIAGAASRADALSFSSYRRLLKIV